MVMMEEELHMAPFRHLKLLVCLVSFSSLGSGPLFFVCHKRTLNLKDVPQLASSDIVRHVFSDFEHNL